ncbi:MAG: DUF3078 domain-containing protein [Bacteroidales bacterium]|nr:DUF3078 domain-containing protein [Candidatus Cacconaster merdequi]
MKRFFLFAFLLITVAAGAQTKAPADSAKKESYWKPGISTSIGFSQLSLTNWAAGGYGQLSLNTYADVFANYYKDKIMWQNEVQAGYGFIESFEDGYQKSDDRLIVDSKFGYRAVEKLYFSAIFNFRSQFAKGYNNKTEKLVISDFLAPANMSLGIGIDYTPGKNLAINIAPLTGKTVMVKIPELRTKYGNAEDQFCRFELGAQVKIDGKIEVKDFKVASTLVLFSDYLNDPQKIKVTWDVNAEAKLSKLFSVTLRTNLLYDDKVLITKKDGQQTSAGIQFKELFSINFTYSIGSKK